MTVPPSTTADVRAALELLYDFASSAHRGYDDDMRRVVNAYTLLIDYISDVMAPPAPGEIEPERLRALCRLFVESGDMTPYALIKFDQVLQGQR